jgi:hypothetical protein
LPLLFWKENIKEWCHSDDLVIGTGIILKLNSRNITASVYWIYLVSLVDCCEQVKKSGNFNEKGEAWLFLDDGG